MMHGAHEKSTTPSTRTAAREAFFLEAARSVRSHFPSILLLVTGGFRSRAGMEHAFNSGACDLIGLGRPATLFPDLPWKVVGTKPEPDEAAFHLGPAPVSSLLKMLPMVRIISGGAETVCRIGFILVGMAMGSCVGCSRIGG